MFTVTMIPLVVMQVDSDINPGSAANCINNNARGAIPVAILGAADLYVEHVNLDSLTLEGLAIKMNGKSNRFLVHTDYVNEDEYLDLVVQFEDSDSWIGSGEALATLTGELYDGTPIEGDDYICVVP